MDILYQSDNNYAPYMGVSILSLFENNKTEKEINVYVIDDSISQGNIEKLHGMAKEYGRKIILLNPSDILNDRTIIGAFKYNSKRLNAHSFLKLLFQRMLKTQIERILYIDCDTIILGNLSELFTIDMSTYSIGMVQDSLLTKSKESIGLKNTDRYYNSGVILFNVHQWKENNCEYRIIDHLKNKRIYGTVDQDVLNIVLKTEIFTLPVKYNLQPLYLDYSLKQYNRVYRHAEPYYKDPEIEEAVQSPAILHFLRYLGQSPWHIDSIHPCRKIFDQYLELSPWNGMTRNKSKNDLAFRIERILYKCLPKSVFLLIFNIYHEHMIEKANSKI